MATAGTLPQYPLYLSQSLDGSLVAISSDISPLLRIFPTDRINMRRIVSLLAWQEDVEPGATAFERVRRLRSCETTTVDRDGIRSKVQIPRVGSSYMRGTPQELAAELRRQLEVCVERATFGAKRVVVQVGGGLDSSGLLALTLRQRDAKERDVTALAQVWASPGDDRPHLATLESSFGILAMRSPARDAGPWFLQSLCVDRQPQPFGSGCLEMSLWTAGAALNPDIMISGHGGDEVLGGDISFAPLVLRGHPLDAIMRALRLRLPWAVSSRQRLAGWILGPLLRPYVPKSWLVTELRRRRRIPWMTKHAVEILDSLLAGAPTRRPRTPDEKLERICADPFFGELCMSWGQISSVTSAATIDVFRDPELVKFVAQIDPVMLSYGDRFRGLYRLALEGLLPDSIRLREDKALGQPAVASAALAADAAQALRNLSSIERAQSLGLVDAASFGPPFEAWLDVLQRGERDDRQVTDASWHLIWSTLAVEAFLRHAIP